MLALTEDAVIRCAHGGTVNVTHSQSWVTVANRALLAESDPLGRSISACPMATPAAPPCRRTVSVDEGATYSALVRINKKRVCLDTTTGTTDWGLLGVVPYAVAKPGQGLVHIGA
jgi:hypothetical protein